MTTDRTYARAAGVLYLITFVTSIPALALKTPYLEGTVPADSSAVLWAALLEIALALSCIGTAVALYPIVRRVDPALALAFVGSRTLEAATIFAGVIALLALTTIRVAGADGASLVALHDWAFLLGPAVMSATNAAVLGTLMYRGRLIPRAIPIVGLIGAPILGASVVGVVLGAFDQVSTLGLLAALPVAAWELALGLWLVARGVAPTTDPTTIPDGNRGPSGLRETVTAGRRTTG